MTPRVRQMDLCHLQRFQRINVIGTSGSGKSTFARRLAELLELQYYEMDALYWKPDWQESPDDEFLQRVRDVTSQERWVLDGNYTRTMPVKWNRVQLVVWLDLPFALTVFRVTKRAVLRSFTQQEIWSGTGNRESLRKAFFSKSSIIWWAISNHAKNKRKYTEVFSSPQFSHIQFVRLSSRAAVNNFLQSVQESVASSKQTACSPAQVAR